MLVDHARTKLWELGVTEVDILERVHRGLTTDPSGVNPAEAEWVIGRLAELLGWQAGHTRPSSRALNVTRGPPAR